MVNKKIIIIGRRTCPFCVYSIDLCSAKKIENIFLDYENKREILEEYKDFHNQDTVPIILSNDLDTGVVKKIGGYTDLLNCLDEERSTS